MDTRSRTHPFPSPALAWLTVALAGFLAPAAALAILADTSVNAPLVFIGGPTLALGVMGGGIIAGAADGRFWVGVLIAILFGLMLLGCAKWFGMPFLPLTLSTAIALVVAAISFGARGALFARSSGGKGWWIAVFVVAGEAAIVLTALADPEALPEWLLALLPAQWAISATQSSFAGNDLLASGPALLALAATAVATSVVTWLWPRRWPYIVMFTTWLAVSALVYYRPAPPLPQPDVASLSIVNPYATRS